MEALTAANNHRTISEQLISLGINSGQTILLHSSMRALGHVEGGAFAVVRAMRHALGDTGTLVVPTCTPDNSDSSRDYLSRVAGMTLGERRCYRAAIPPFDPETTPSTGMGLIAE